MISQLFFRKESEQAAIVFDCADKTPLTEGGEGRIYAYKGKLLKIYKPCVNLASKQKKIRMLIEKSQAGLLPKEAVCPKEMVMDKNGVFIGFSMDKTDGEEVKQLANRKFVTANNITTKDILSMLIKIQAVMNSLHENHIFIGDFNDRNILFDRQFNIYFIDCDSWTVENEKCEVAMDLFRDPLLQANDFDAGTDTYSFAVLIWKLLTRIHPFGGTMDPDMNIMERMKNGISVINNPKVTIPRTIKSWRNLSPSLIGALQVIFQNNSRVLSDELADMRENIKYCDTHREYYYGKYLTCPLCDSSAKMQNIQNTQIRPALQADMRALKLSAYLRPHDVKLVINESSYLDKDNNLVDIRLQKKVKYCYGIRYYFTDAGYLIEDFSDEFIIHSEKEYRIEKKYKSQIVVEKNHVYFISRQNSFIDMNVLKMGNSIKICCKCSNTAYFAVKEGNYCVLNCYFDRLILNINGNNAEIKYDTDVINYGLHYDNAASKWLMILENSSGKYVSYIIDSSGCLYVTDEIRYHCQLSAPCINGDVIFIPADGRIRGFSYVKGIWKDFACDVVNDGSNLIKKKKGFMIVNDENIWRLE